MAKPAVSEEETQALRDAFSMMDADGSGSITTKEFGMMMRGLGQTVTEAEVQDMVHDIDNDGNGSITLDEFVTMMTGRLKQRDPDEEVKEAFEVFDHAKRGFIDADDIRQVFYKMGEIVSPADADAMIAEADTDDDGRVTFDDFAKMMAKG